MTPSTKEWRTELRKRCAGWRAFDIESRIILSLLDALDSAERELESRGRGHVFEGGTPEAMRDARLRNEIFNCVEQHPTKPKIATWHYGKALQLISDYRAELERAKAKAWEEGFDHASNLAFPEDVDLLKANPYRKEPSR